MTILNVTNKISLGIIYFVLVQVTCKNGLRLLFLINSDKLRKIAMSCPQNSQTNSTFFR